MPLSMPPAPRRAGPRALAAAALLAACSPTFNWREVPIAESGLVALLPCKADRADRARAAGRRIGRVDMTGCEAGGATFAIAHASANGPAQAEAWLGAWRTATRGQIALQGGGRSLESGRDRATRHRHARPAAARGGRKGRLARADPVVRPVAKDGTVALYQATVLGKPSSPEASKTFFEGLRLP
jgi:hypothetical protein